MATNVKVRAPSSTANLGPGFSKVKNNALNAGALGVTISGAGPSVIAFCKKSQNLKKIGKSMEKGFGSAKVSCDIIICKPSVGPRISQSKS